MSDEDKRRADMRRIRRKWGIEQEDHSPRRGRPLTGSWPRNDPRQIDLEELLGVFDPDD